MKKRNWLISLTSLSLWLRATNIAAQFVSGSNGTYGPMNITSNTVLDLPTDSIFHCTTIHVARNVTLSFQDTNHVNTPVYLLATSWDCDPDERGKGWIYPRG